MDPSKAILYELYVYCEWNPEPEYIQKSDGLLPEKISSLKRWLKHLGPKKTLFDSITAHKECQQKWQIALGDEGKVIAVLTDTILEFRTKRSDYSTIAARTTVTRDPYPQWRMMEWSPDCAFLVLAYGIGHVEFYDLSASKLFTIEYDCSRPGGLECTDTAHAIADIIFLPTTAKSTDMKWSWEVLLVSYDGSVRAYMISLTEGCAFHHKFQFKGGLGAVSYCHLHNSLYVATLPYQLSTEPDAASSYGLTAWRLLNEEPHLTLSVVSDNVDAQANDKFKFYIPFTSSKKMSMIIEMQLSPDSTKLVCLHSNGDITVWRLPLLKLLHKFPLTSQPGHDLRNPLVAEKETKKDPAVFHAADVNWWSNEEIILSRFSGSVTVCGIEDLVNLLSNRCEFLQGAPRVTRAFDAGFLALECEAAVLPARRSPSDESVEVVKAEDEDDSLFEMVKELLKTVIYAITDIETFQPKPRRITCVSRVYRLLAVKSTTPSELFSRKIESGQYGEALKLAQTFGLDSDLVHQQQWRKDPVSTDAIQNYLSKVSKKIWAVHQCVDRLPETLPAARELLQFGLQLTNEHILEEVNRGRAEPVPSPDHVAVEHLNAYTSELLRCRHVMLFYKERLFLYEQILKQEKSTYDKDEYHRLRCNSILHSAMEIAKEGRIFALHCLWPHVTSVTVKLAILEKLPETIPPFLYQHLLPTVRPIDKETIGEEVASFSIEVPEPMPYEDDWCRKTIFRSIWSSNWSDEASPDGSAPAAADLAAWYARRARQIELHTSMVTNALTLITLAHYAGGVPKLERIFFDLITLDTIVYEINKEGITLKDLEKMTVTETCKVLMSMSSADTFIEDLNRILLPFLRRYQKLVDAPVAADALYEYLETISEEDLCPILLLMQNPEEFELEWSERVSLAYRCLMAYNDTDQLDIAIELLEAVQPQGPTYLSEELHARLRSFSQLVQCSSMLVTRGVSVPPRDLAARALSPARARAVLARLARDLGKGETKPTQGDWEKLLKDIMELQEKCFHCISINQCYEIYASALLTSGDAASIKLAGAALTLEAAGAAPAGPSAVPYGESVGLVLQAGKEYFNSASALNDPALDLAKCCLSLIKDINPVIQEELDLIAALQIISSFNVNILPIQVRLSENKLQLIEECLASEPSAVHAAHRLLRLAALLRVEGDDDVAREGEVLTRVCGAAGARASPAAVDAARRLAALRFAPAAGVIAQVAEHASTDRETRKDLFAAAVTHCTPDNIESILLSRLELELEGLKEMGVTMKETQSLSDRCPSTEDEYADAITTPVVEKKDLVPSRPVKKIPLFNYLLDSFQNKFSIGQARSPAEAAARAARVPEFYNSLYPEFEVSDSYYRYDRFAVPRLVAGGAPAGHAVLQWFYLQNWLYVAKGVDLRGTQEVEIENEVIQKCADELIYADTSMGVACLLRGAGPSETTAGYVGAATNDVAISCALYAASIYCNSAEMKDNVYLAAPKQLASKAINNKSLREDQMELIRQCIDRLSGMSEVETLRARGLTVNGLLFNADPDYRRVVIVRLARLPGKENLDLAMSLASKYHEDALESWLQHASADPAQAHLTADSLPKVDRAEALERILRVLYPEISGSNHAALIQIFSVLKGLDEKQLIAGLTSADHIKLLKKCKAASPELDYKLIIEQAPRAALSAHLVSIARADNIGMLGKLLRALPPAVRPALSPHALYTQWLVKYFFSVPKVQESSKKWMQQYRQCASYFNKLSKEELMKFVDHTCFSAEAVAKVPHGTRNLMIMQAVDYCTQEQENEIKANKTEQTWAQVGQELARWARFLENYHSASVQNIIENTGIKKNELWLEIEMSHGDADKMTGPASALIGHYDVQAGLMTSLLQCLGVALEPPALFHHLAEKLDNVQSCEALVDRLVRYNVEGVKFPEHTIELMLKKSGELGLPSHRQIGLMTIRGSDGAASEDLPAVARFTRDILNSEFLPYAAKITEEELMTDEGRREAFAKFEAATETLQQRKALVDILACWPPTRDSGSLSLHCGYLHRLLHSAAPAQEQQVYVRLLVKRPLLTDEEIQHLTAGLPGHSVPSMMWIIILNKCANARDYIMKLVEDHDEIIKDLVMEPQLVKSLLDLQMLIPLVPTSAYPHLVSYIVHSGEKPYTVSWAVAQLEAAKFYSEAGHICLYAWSVPTHLRGFSQTVRFSNNAFLFDAKMGNVQ